MAIFGLKRKVKKIREKSLSLGGKTGAARRAELLSPVRSPNPGDAARTNWNNSGTSAKKKATGFRLWMRFDRFGRSETFECEKSAIIKRAAIPSRDLRILGPVFSHSSNILAREKAIVVNLEFIKAIVTAEEVLLLDPVCQEVIPFVDQLKQQLLPNSSFRIQEPDQTRMQSKEMCSDGGEWLPANEAAEGEQSELPFEFLVLEVALEVVCVHLDASVTDLERNAYPLLDELAKNVSTKNLEHVRGLKSAVTRLLARVQKVRDEIEHLLDNDQDMAHLHLSRKQIQNQQLEALMAAGPSDSIVASAPHLARLSSATHRRASFSTSIILDVDGVEDLEMLLEAYFIQLDGIRNRIISVREYIDDTEDYVNIQLDNHRNELIQLQVILGIFMTGIAIDTLIAGAFAMNIPNQTYEIYHIFTTFVGGTSFGSLIISVLILVYARRKKLLGS